jgi:transposase-like protein
MENTKKKSPRYSPEVRERAVRMVLEHQGDRESQWKVIASIAAKFGCSGETLRSWVRKEVSIPRSLEREFHGDPSADSTRTRARIPRVSEQ